MISHHLYNSLWNYRQRRPVIVRLPLVHLVGLDGDYYNPINSLPTTR